MRFSLENNIIPILTTKKVAWKTCLKELLWFIKGSTDNEILIQNGVKIWNGNSSRSYLDSIGLINNKENDLGPVYGHQWRHFNATYVDNKTNYNGKGIDQLQNIIDLLKNPSTRNSRRIILSSWNPLQLDQMALPPCHILAQFNVHGGNKLSCALYQRSGDIGLGVPFNILSYSFLTHLLAKHCNLIPYEFVHFIGNTHIYDDHIEPLKQQIKRVPFNFPTIEILHKYDDINKYTLDDFIIKNYQYYDKIPMEMRN
jgi:thymidylate synthase